MADIVNGCEAKVIREGLYISSIRTLQRPDSSDVPRLVDSSPDEMQRKRRDSKSQ
jgi:hypothetical protein